MLNRLHTHSLSALPTPHCSFSLPKQGEVREMPAMHLHVGSLRAICPSILPCAILFIFECLSDVNECSTGDHECISPALCVNTDGSYYCNCPYGDIDSAGTACDGVFHVP